MKKPVKVYLAWRRALPSWLFDDDELIVSYIQAELSSCCRKLEESVAGKRLWP